MENHCRHFVLDLVFEALMKRPVLFLLILVFSSCSPNYKVKNKKVYYTYFSIAIGGWENKLVKGADYRSFLTLESGKYLYGKDQKNVYFKNEVIPGADPNTFKLIEKGYAVDYKRAYYYNDSIVNSSSINFKVIDNYYSKDYQDVYYEDKPMNVCSVDNFRLIYEDENKFNRWSTDGCGYFKKMFKVPTLDYESLITYKNYDVSKDRYYVYYQDRKIEVSYEEKWKNYIDTIDVESFKVLGFNHYKDKYGCINMYGRFYHGGRESCQ